MQALLKVADKLQARNTWDIKSVREWSEVSQEARRHGTKAHAGRIFPIVAQRNSEVLDGHPEKLYKGRIVYGGDEVKDENSAAAIFEELSSSPAGLKRRNQ